MWTGSTNSNWNNNGNWSSGSAPAAGDNVIIANVANQPNFNNGNAVGFIYLKTGATLTIPSSKTFTVTNDFINCGTLNNSGALTMGSTSSTNQYITGSGTYNMADLTINNTATTPTVTLNVPISMSGVLTLTSGLLNTTSTNLLTLQNGATAPALTAASTSYVNGPMAYQKSTSGSTTLNFPIGKSPDCRPVILTANHSTTTLYNYTGECFNANPWTTFGSTTTDMPTNTIDTISGVHYVTIARTDGSGTSQPSAGLSGNQTIQMFFGTNDFVYQGSKLSIVKNTSATPATWIDIGGTSALGSFSTPQAGSVTSTSAPSAFTSFSSFALGSRRTGWNSLPIDLLSFTATPNKTFVELKWVSQTETNNRSYTIERSNDGVTFSDLKTVPSKAPGGNSLQALSYSEKDHKPLPGTSYYRLKQTDINGASKTYNIVSVNISSNGQVVFTVYPNPNQGEFNVDFSGLENNHEVEVYMHDMLGKEVYHNIFTAQEQMGSFSIVPEQKISAGPYLVSLYLEGIKYQVKVLVN